MNLCIISATLLCKGGPCGFIAVEIYLGSYTIVLHAIKIA